MLGKDNLDGVRKAFLEARRDHQQLLLLHQTDRERWQQFTTGEDAGRRHRDHRGRPSGSRDWETIGDNIRSAPWGAGTTRLFGNHLTRSIRSSTHAFWTVTATAAVDLIDRTSTSTPSRSKGSPHTTSSRRQAGRHINGELPRASHFANTIDLYNPTYDDFSHKGRIISDGYYCGHESDPIVKFNTVTEDGRQFYKMQVNDRYAGTSEEALRAVTMIEYHNHLAATESEFPIKDPVQSAVTALMTGVASLKYDQGNDEAVFNAIKKHLRHPGGVKLSDAKAILAADKRDYTGSVRLANQWLERMDERTKAQAR